MPARSLVRIGGFRNAPGWVPVDSVVATVSLLESESPGVHGPTQARDHEGYAVRPYPPAANRTAGGDPTESRIARDDVTEHNGCDR